MNWSKNKNELKHCNEYLCCLDIDDEMYSLLIYYANASFDVEFNGSGFYYLDEDEDVWRLSFSQPVCWCEITKP